MSEYYLGIDLGSTTVKAVLMTGNGKVCHTLYQRTKPTQGKRITCTSRCAECGACNLGNLKNTIDEFLAGAGIKTEDLSCTVATGSQVVEDTKRFVHYDFQISEVSAHVAGALHYHPKCKAILDVGGQDSKAMIFNNKMKMWTSKMSGICAAGTGAFLDSIATKLNIPVDEMDKKVNYDSELEFSSICAVLSATSVNKFKNRFPIGQIIGGACRAQARTIMSGVGEIFHNYKGDIIFQGGVAYNRAVAYFLKEITGNNIIIPEFHGVMGALGSACLAKKHAHLNDKLTKKSVTYSAEPLKSIQMRSKMTRQQFLGKRKEPLVWRNLFFPTEILNAMDARMLTLETYAALFARNTKKIKKAFDNATYKGFAAETCSFLRVLEGMELPEPAFGVSTSQPCQQGERIFKDLIRTYGKEDQFYSLHTPITNDSSAIEHMAADLEHSVKLLEKALGKKMDMGRLAEACHFSNEAKIISDKCTDLRFNSPPLIRGSQAVYFAMIFSQLWGKPELVKLQQQFYEDLMEQRERIGDSIKIEDTHRILWLHLPPFYDSRLLDYIEVSCNAPIVFEEVNYTGWGLLDENDPYRALAKKLLQACFLDPQLRVDTIRENTSKAKFNGCILYNHMFGRCAMADASFTKHLREELNQALIPLLVLDGDCMDQTTDPCSTYTKVSSYIEALNSQKFGNIFGQIDAKKAPAKRAKKVIPFQQTSDRNSSKKIV